MKTKIYKISNINHLFDLDFIVDYHTFSMKPQNEQFITHEVILLGFHFGLKERIIPTNNCGITSFNCYPSWVLGQPGKNKCCFASNYNKPCQFKGFSCMKVKMELKILRDYLRAEANVEFSFYSIK